MPTESQVFEDEVHPATERTDQPAEEVSERHDHGKNLSGKDRIKLCAKSFISQVYDLLARHSPSNVLYPIGLPSLAAVWRVSLLPVTGRGGDVGPDEARPNWLSVERIITIESVDWEIVSVSDSRSGSGA